MSAVGQLPTQLPRRNNLSLKEGDVGLHHQKSGCYGVVRLRNGEMTMETRVGVHMVRMKFAWVSPFLHCSLVSFGGMMLTVTHPLL